MTDLLLLCLIFGWNPISIIFKLILLLGFFWLITRKEFRITIGVIGLIVLIYYQPRVLIVIAIVAIIYKLCNLTTNQKASISKFFKRCWKFIVYIICVLVFLGILYAIIDSNSVKDVDDKKDTKNQIVNTKSDKPSNKNHQTTGIKNEITKNEELKVEEKEEVIQDNYTVIDSKGKEDIQQTPQEEEKLYDSNGKEIILDPIDMNDYPDFNWNMDINLYYNCQTYTGWRKNKIENEWKSHRGSRGCRVAVIYSEPDDACLGLSACGAGGTQFYNMLNLYTNQYVYSCISSNCETEFQKKLDVLRPFPMYELIYGNLPKIYEEYGVDNTTTTNTTTNTYTNNYVPYVTTTTTTTRATNSEPERKKNPYPEYEDYYEDIWYDYYGGYKGLEKHYDDWIDEFGEEEEYLD